MASLPHDPAHDLHIDPDNLQETWTRFWSQLMTPDAIAHTPELRAIFDDPDYERELEVSALLRGDPVLSEIFTGMLIQVSKCLINGWNPEWFYPIFFMTPWKIGLSWTTGADAVGKRGGMLYVDSRGPNFYVLHN